MPGTITFAGQTSGGESLAVRQTSTLTPAIGAPVLNLTITSAILRSTDDQTWTEVYSGQQITTVAQGPGLTVMAGFFGTVAASTDGITWTRGTFSTGPYGNFSDSAFANGKFYLLAGMSGGYKNPTPAYTPYFYESSDGLNWTQLSSLPAPAQQVAWGNGVFVTCSPASSTFGARSILRSTNGVDWAEVATFPGSAYVCFANDRFILADRSGNTRTSADGITWTNGPTISAAGLTTSKVEVQDCSQGFIATVAGTDSAGTIRTAILTSLDDRSWNQRSGQITGALDAV